ncbi:spinocerebellar ataxia type 10 protein domain-containing protein [Entophlyctis helioformis]|nr:spinocerebellar ataxia type 10 protein domain-containing protein [Entophlyctis helioformis]
MAAALVLQQRLADSLNVFVHLLEAHTGLDSLTSGVGMASDAGRALDANGNPLARTAASNLQQEQLQQQQRPPTPVPLTPGPLTQALAQVNLTLARTPNLRRLPPSTAGKLWTLFEAQLAAVRTLLGDRDAWDRSCIDFLRTTRRLFEWMRNSCAGVPENQILACEIKAHVVANDILISLLDWRNHTGEEHHRSEATLTINMGVQALANMATANLAVQARTWPLFAGESQLLSLFMLHAEPAASKNALVWIYNCTMDHQVQSAMLVDSASGADVVASLLRIFSEEADGNEANFDLAYACLKNLLVADLVPNIWASIDNFEETDMSQAHVSLLKALDGLINAAEDSQQEQTIRLPQTSLHLASVLVRTIQRFSDLVANPDPQPDASFQHFSTYIVLLLQYFGTMSQRASAEDRTRWLDTGLSKALIELMHAMTKVQPVVVSRAKEASPEVQESMYYMIKCDAMKVIANMAYESRRAQDEIRECGGIAVVLSHCVLDDMNPFLREYSLFAIHNLTKGNKANQDLIGSLEAKKVIPNEMIDQLGVHVEIDKSTGKLKFKKDGSTPSASVSASASGSL